jgi:hypothetical protein
MPPDKAELNMRHFADRVLPILQRDALFNRPVVPPGPVETRRDDVFAPA